MNRQLMEIYGTNASKLMPHFWPDYDPRYSSPQGQTVNYDELVARWAKN